MNRDSFLQRVREAARAGQAYRVATRELPDGAAYVGVDGDVCEAFAAEVDAVGGQSHLVRDLPAARIQLQSLLRDYGVRRALCWRHAVLDQLGLDGLLREESIECHEHSNLASLPLAEQRLRALAAEIGISSVDIAIGETGTLMVFARPGQERMATLVPPIHVAVVCRDQIVPDLFDAFARLRPESLPSNISLITGPSKTGDIELQLTTGVHGPGKWHVIVVTSR